MSINNVATEIQKSDQTFTGSASRSSASITNNTDEQVSVTVTGAALGDYVIGISYSIDLANITLTGYVSAANTVKANFINNTGGDITLGAGTVYVIVMKKI